MPHSMHEAQTPAQRGHEAFHLDTRYLNWFSVAIIVLLIVTAAVAFLLLGGFRLARLAPIPGTVSDAPIGVPAPALQSAPAGELAQYRRGKSAQLQGYRWIDRSAGIVQIPIEQAMRLQAAQPAAMEPGR